MAAHILVKSWRGTFLRLSIWLIIVFGAIAMSVDPGVDLDFMLMVVCLPVTVIVLFALPWSERRRLAAHLAKNRKMFKETQFTFDDLHLEGKSESGSFRLRWQDIVRYKEGKRVVVVFESQSYMRIIPKSCFESEEELGSFLQILKLSSSQPRR